MPFMTATAAQPSTRPGALRAYVIVTAVLVLLVLIQAILAGQGLQVNGELIATHGHVGNASFVVGLAAAVLAVLARVPRRQVILAGISLLLLFTQTGMGYIGRNSEQVAAWHIALGVVTFAVVVLQHVGAIGVSKGGRGSSS